MKRGRPNELEYRISLDLPGGISFPLGIAFFEWGCKGASPLAWPPGMSDACIDEQLLRGFTPPRLGFDVSTWGRVEIVPAGN